MYNVSELTSDLVQEAFTDALRQHVGFRKAMSAEGLAQATGIDVRTIKAYAAGECCPNLARMMQIMAVLPPEFANRVLQLAGLGGAHRLDETTTDSLRLNESATAMTALIARHLADDGRIDHREEAEQEPAVRQLAACCEAWLNRRSERQNVAALRRAG